MFLNHEEHNLHRADGSTESWEQAQYTLALKSLTTAQMFCDGRLTKDQALERFVKEAMRYAYVREIWLELS